MEPKSLSSTEKPAHRQGMAAGTVPREARVRRRPDPALFLSIKTTFLLAGLLVVTIGMGAAYAPLLSVAVAAVAIYGLTSAENALKGLALIYVLRAANPAFLSEEFSLSAPAILSVLLCSTRIYVDAFLHKPKIPASVTLLAMAVLVCLVLSVIVSPFLTVSVFKLVNFATVAGAILIGFSVLSRKGRDIRPWLFSFYSAVGILSAPLLFHPFGYFRDGEGFQGILNHPQEYAIFMAPFAAMLIMKAFSSREQTKVTLVILGYVVATLLMTRARTSALALLLGMVFVYVVHAGHALRGVLGVRTGVIGGLSVLVVPLLVSTVYLVSTETTEAFTSFVFKGSDGALSDAFEASRGRVMSESLNNFRSHPWTGVGFGVNVSEIRPSEPVYETITGLPISFPTEKANLIVALLEECGVIGFVAFLLLIGKCVRDFRYGSVLTSAAALTSLFTNIGEMTFFSMNSYGLFTWLLIGAATYVPREGARSHALDPKVPAGKGG